MTTLVGVWLLTLLPSVPLLCIYWAFRTVLVSKKFEMRMILLRGESLTKYLSAYGSTQGKITEDLEDEEARASLVSGIVDQIFRLEYSKSEYLPALLLNVFVTVLLMLLAMSSVGIPMGLPPVLTEHLPNTSEVTDIIAGGVGAFIWGIYELAERYRSGDLAPDSLFRMAARMLIASAVGALVGVIVNERLAWPIAFGVGVLPVATVKSFISERTLKALKLSSAPTIQENPPFTCLQGWNQDVCDKLQLARITSVEQLACTNPFQIFLRSNLDWRVILDLCDQALLVVYIAENAEKIRKLGFRSAVELAVIDWDKDNSEFFADMSRDDVINQIASSLGMETLPVRMLIRSISEDITVSLIATLWSDDTPGEHNDEEQDDDNGTPQEKTVTDKPRDNSDEGEAPPHPRAISTRTSS